jgi:hypothetical protein
MAGTVPPEARSNAAISGSGQDDDATVEPPTVSHVARRRSASALPSPSPDTYSDRQR